MDTSFEDLLKRVSPTLKRITYKLNGHLSVFNDEDLFQEAVVHLWQGFQCGKLTDKTDSYILQGCFFHQKNYIRKVRPKSRCVSLDEMQEREEGSNLDELSQFQTAGDCDFRNHLSNKMLLELIQGDGLTTRELETLNFCLDGLTTREIGERMGVSHVMVVKIMHKVKEKCKKYRD